MELGYSPGAMVCARRLRSTITFSSLFEVTSVYLRLLGIGIVVEAEVQSNKEEMLDVVNRRRTNGKGTEYPY